MTSVPAPPSHLKSGLRTDTLPAGTVLHRFHSDAYLSHQFNDNPKAKARFSPLFDPAGSANCLRVIYAAQDVAVAAFESLLRDRTPYPSSSAKYANRERIGSKLFCGKAYSTLSISRDLTLAMLHSPDLRRYGAEPSQVTETLRKHYGDTAKWAQAFYDQCPGIDGLVWTSRQNNTGPCYLLFGTRIANNEINPITTRFFGARPRSGDISLWNEMEALCKSHHIDIV